MKIAKTVFRLLLDFIMKANEDNYRKGDIMGFKLKDGDVVIDGESGKTYEAHYGDSVDTAEGHPSLVIICKLYHCE